ncbi:MAG: serine/threonine protein kinase [Leptolyngbya sp. PLA3]|nr:MAG: serine/threonine protein kinase [Cyanobacteria bacterium CYA]MCE7969851.1 serine/threonine protein kinase [Leptolyngbya sp. PL-A3]
MAEGPVPKQKGDLVEGYRIMAEIGRGAASIIYVVQDVKTKQVWALKHVQKSGPKDQRFLDQAEAEYRISQELSHPNIRAIPKIIKKGSLLSVRELYLVMELVDGQSLEVHPPRTFEEAVNIFKQTARALSHMHQRGFVHADMKPHNIVISSEGEVKLIDLGQSCKIGTIKERIQGTPDYIAPEQVHRREITPRTDVYNMGATMYWTLTRQHIPTALAKGDSLVGSIDDNFIEKPRPAFELNPRIHPKLNELIMQCVEVDPKKRPETMAWVADRLELILGILLAAADRDASGTDMPPPTEG